MMVETVLSRSVRLICAGGLAFGMHAAVAQSGDAAIQRVEITGSSIKRITAEGALPVQTLSKAQIEQSGAASVADLIATLPSMQGFTTSSMSVNGGGGGLQSASIHSIGEGYTLVLLNGRRLAPATSGSTVNLASIPLAAVERVEILTDGANTLYGSDAIAGVVNFILKKNQTDAIIEGSYSQPRSRGGRTQTASISKGWGDIDKDGFNVLVSASHDETKASWARDRDFSKSGVIPFSANGKNYSLYQLSSNSMPGTATVQYTNADQSAGSVLFSPNLLATGACNGSNLFRISPTRCQFDYAATVQNTPAIKRDSVFASLNYKISDSANFFAEALGSSFTNTAQYAPPAQPLGVPLNSALYARAIAPYLARVGVPAGATVDSATMSLRLVDAGGRADNYKTVAKHLAFGVDGGFKGFDYRAAFTHSENKQTDTAAGGYMSLNAFDALVTSGAFDPFAPPGTSQAILAPAVLDVQFGETKSTLDQIQASATTELFKMPAGAAQLAVGADFTRQKYSEAPSAYNQGPNKQQPDFTDAAVGGTSGALPVDASRKNWGAYGELLLPVLKNMDLTASTRYDDFGAVTNDKNFDADGNLLGSGKQGKTASKATYKLALRWNPVEMLLVRASYGTGFKAPVLTDIVKPLVNGGSSQFHNCPITSPTDPRYRLCHGPAEYALLTGGNAATGEGALLPEESKQATLGFRLEPIPSLSLGFDFWDVKLTNQIATLSENLVFENPAVYDSLLRSYFDPIQKQDVLVAALTPFNLSTAHYQGIDWDHTYRTSTALGKVALQWTGTFMTKAEQDNPGTGLEKNIGRFNSYADVTFRVISKLTASLRTNMFLHSLTANYHSGYTDQEYNEDNSVVREVLADGSLGGYVPLTRRVSSYTTFDWQTKAQLTKQFSLTAGIKNLADMDPPFTMRNAGGGNQSGYDGRYTDPLGRTFYLTGNYKF
ncbi:iron complex outermembrane recepter protein [Duganella sp. CF517]|uniref:TonB-dependent receptor domain-containing protein n=1 Tax=Duganella sp. CF517 TaxID=1881038 RepID=UPI0008C26635|nr:TonB-dependent receptor [Duganella sp. CF517]SEN55576.1 iron complex outermembrane recepter protein [Duganella sp. CF517]